MPAHLKKNLDQAHLQNGTYEQIVTHEEQESEMNGWKPLMSHKQTRRASKPLKAPRSQDPHATNVTIRNMTKTKTDS